MKKPLFFFLALFLLNPSQGVSEVSVNVGPNETVELLSVVMTLSGAPEYNHESVWPEYKELVDSCFGVFKDHSAVKLAGKYRKYGLNWSFPMVIAVNSEIRNGDFISNGHWDDSHYNWPSKRKRKFRTALDDFYKETDFAAFYQKNKDLYQPVIDAFEKMYLPRVNMRAACEYIGLNPVDTLQVYLSYLAGDYNYGVAQVNNGTDIPRPVIGIFDRVEFIRGTTPFYRYRIPVLILHEGLHLYCNPLIDKYEADLLPLQDAIYPPIREQLAAKAYSTWKTVLYEALLRASVIVLMEENKYTRAEIEQHVDKDVKNGFYWIPGLVDVLKRYQTQRDRYPDLDSFMPEVVDFYRKLAESKKTE